MKRVTLTDNIFIVYYSRTGNTKRIAKISRRQVGGTLHKIIPENAYPNAYDAVVAQAKREIKSGHRPPLQ